MSRRAFNSLLAIFALQSAASAADLPAQKAAPAPAPLMFSWEGGYLGTQAGYGFNTVRETGFDPIPGYANLANPVSYSQNYSSRGPFSGFHFGYNKQYGQFVLGAEADFDFTGQHTNKVLYNSLGAALGGPTQTNIADNLRWMARARAGYADGKTLYYLTGGLVSGTSTVQQNYWALSSPVVPVADYFNIQRFGWTAGAGIEYAFSDVWSGRIEYHHNDFGTATVNSVQVPGLTFRERSAEDIVELGISYHIGAPGAAAAVAAASEPKAKYEPPPPPDPTFIGRLYHGYKDEWGAQFRTIPTRRRAAAPVTARQRSRRRPTLSPNGPMAARRRSPCRCPIRSTRR